MASLRRIKPNAVAELRLRQYNKLLNVSHHYTMDELLESLTFLDRLTQSMDSESKGAVLLERAIECVRMVVDQAAHD